MNPIKTNEFGNVTFQTRNVASADFRNNIGVLYSAILRRTLNLLGLYKRTKVGLCHQ